ncbi:hypothetical protein ABKA04_004816 [Annulohypoxylon sp. FPYF3050]
MLRLKWSIGIIFGLINLSVYLIWIPARLQINETYIAINDVWDRIEKGIFCIIDGSLNVYFIYVVRKDLISNGLTKYMPLFIFNIVMLTFSLSLDKWSLTKVQIILIGVMSLGQIYFQFHPFVYLLKLYIEMNITDLIAKIVRADNRVSYCSKAYATKACAAAADETISFNGIETVASSSDTRVPTLYNGRYSRDMHKWSNADPNQFKISPFDSIQRPAAIETERDGYIELEGGRISPCHLNGPSPPRPCLVRRSSTP